MDNELTKKCESESDAKVEAVSTSKRAALKAAWAAPVIVAISLPRSGFAANISRHGNEAHEKHHHKDDKKD